MTLEKIMETIETINNSKAILGSSPDAYVELYFQNTCYASFRTFEEAEAFLTKHFIASIVNQIMDADFNESCYAGTFYTTIEHKGDKLSVELFIDC